MLPMFAIVADVEVDVVVVWGRVVVVVLLIGEHGGLQTTLRRSPKVFLAVARMLANGGGFFRWASEA